MTSGTVEIDFAAGYPSGKAITVTIQALAGSTILGSGSGTITASGTCQTLSITVTPGGTIRDMSAGAGDMSGDMPAAMGDLATPSDLAGCTTIYVSASTGDDGNGGCTPSSPKKTIAGGLGVSSGRDVVVCKGTYNENVTATRNLHGGYSCTSWARTATFGYPTFDGTNESIVQTPTAAVNGLLANTASVTVDGFTFTMGGAMGSLGGKITASGVTLKNCKLNAGSLASSGTIGLDIEAGGDEVYNDLIDGGSGTGSGLGSTAVLLNGQSHVHDNTLHPGGGTSNSGGTGCMDISVGASVGNLTHANNAAIERNTINSGNCSSFGAMQYASSIGISLPSVAMTQTIEVTGNIIDAGTGNDPTIGIDFSGSGQLVLTGNRVFGGKPLVGFGIGIRLGGNGVGVALYDNEVHGGEGPSTIAIESGAANTTLKHNTIHAGHSGSGSGIGMHITNATSALTIVNNLFFGEATNVGMQFDQCPNYTVTWQNNVYAYTTVAKYTSMIGTPCTASATFRDVTAFNTEASARVITSGNNWYIDSGCSNSDLGATGNCHQLPGCDGPLDGSGQAGVCIGGILAVYDQASDGVNTLLGSGGWTLKNDVLCIVAQTSVQDINASVPGLSADWDGDPRMSGHDSVGADEYDGTCAN
jgi:hypothetical protein